MKAKHQWTKFGKGLRLAEIGAKLGIGVRTVKTHTGSIYSKLGVKNRAQCMRPVGEIDLL